MSNRDTQFQGFAKALLDEILEAEIGRVKSTYWRGAVESIIARRACDLAMHVLGHSRSNDMEDWQIEEIIPFVPDMTELPKEQE